MDIALWSPPNCPTAASAAVLSQAAGRGEHAKGLWIDPVRFLELIDGWTPAQWACHQAALWRSHFHPALLGGAIRAAPPKPTATRQSS